MEAMKHGYLVGKHPFLTLGKAIEYCDSCGFPRDLIEYNPLEAKKRAEERIPIIEALYNHWYTLLQNAKDKSSLERYPLYKKVLSIIIRESEIWEISQI